MRFGRTWVYVSRSVGAERTRNVNRESYFFEYSPSTSPLAPSGTSASETVNFFSPTSILKANLVPASGTWASDPFLSTLLISPESFPSLSTLYSHVNSIALSTPAGFSRQIIFFSSLNSKEILFSLTSRSQVPLSFLKSTLSAARAGAASARTAMAGIRRRNMQSPPVQEVKATGGFYVYLGWGEG